ncbi:MAG: beta strand repeat-containing protein, partial [Immundisolibacter sp.]|uniref:beta strand repeat-containing protein n=1 Tax=Immundisolibacter sp. TaxID=1934948 RepID=UPI003EE25BAB
PPPPPPPPAAINGTEGDDTLTGTPGADVINGLGGNDTINGLAGADTLNGGTGDDTFLYNTDDVAGGETINGGGGMDTMYVQTSTGFSGLAPSTLLTDGAVERVLIQTRGAANVQAQFLGSQLHDQAIVVNTYNDPDVTDSENIAQLLILGFGANNDFSQLDFADSSDAEGVGAFDPVNGESIVILGSGGPDTVIGTSKSNFFFVTDGGDTLTGGATNDGFIFGPSNTTTDGLTIFGGGGVDSLQASDSTNFTGLNGAAKLLDNSIERIFIPTASATQINAIFDGKQLSDQIIIVNTLNDPVAGANGAALTINVTGAANFSQLDFNKSTSISEKSGAGILPFVSGTDIIIINGSAGADTITGTSINDRIFSSLGADSLSGGDGNDLFTYFGSFSSTVSVSGDPAVDQALDDTISGGAGDDSVLVYFSTDFRNLSNGTVALTDPTVSIERILVHTKSNFNTFAIFNGSQLHDQVIAVNTYDDPLVAPTANFAALSIFASGADNDFSKLTFAKIDTTSTDVAAFSSENGGRIFITGSAGADTVTGTSGSDAFFAFTAGDVMDGGGGPDVFVFRAGDAVDGVTLNGGIGTDNINTSVTTDLSKLNGGVALTSNSIEVLTITSKGADVVTATLDGAQLSGQAISINTFNDPAVTDTANVATLTINVTTGAADFSQLKFDPVYSDSSAFVSGTDIIIINGSAGADTITGTSINDSITGGGGADMLAGGGGANLFNFTDVDGDIDTTIVAVTDIISDFVSGTDRLDFTIAGSGTNYTENLTGAADLAALLSAADTALDGVIRYYFGVVSGDGYLVHDGDGNGYTSVIQLTGVTDMAFGDIV